MFGINLNTPVPANYKKISKKYRLYNPRISGYNCFRLVDITNTIVFSMSIYLHNLAIFIREDGEYNCNEIPINESYFNTKFGKLVACKESVDVMCQYDDSVFDIIEQVMIELRTFKFGTSRKEIKEHLEKFLLENGFD